MILLSYHVSLCIYLRYADILSVLLNIDLLPSKVLLHLTGVNVLFLFLCILERFCPLLTLPFGLLHII